MPVSIRVAVIRLVNVDNDTNEIVDKNSRTTKMSDILRSTTLARVYENGTGASESPNAGSKTVTPLSIEAYLEAEAGDNHALAYFDQSRIITQEIT